MKISRSGSSASSQRLCRFSTRPAVWSCLFLSFNSCESNLSWASCAAKASAMARAGQGPGEARWWESLPSSLWEVRRGDPKWRPMQQTCSRGGRGPGKPQGGIFWWEAMSESRLFTTSFFQEATTEASPPAPNTWGIGCEACVLGPHGSHLPGPGRKEGNITLRSHPIYLHVWGCPDAATNSGKAKGSSLVLGEGGTYGTTSSSSRGGARPRRTALGRLHQALPRAVRPAAAGRRGAGGRGGAGQAGHTLQSS